MKIPFNKIYTLPESASNVGQLTADPARFAEKHFTKQCERFFESLYPGYHALMVGSCTRALELIAMSLGLDERDEIVMPSFNYVGVANAFAQTGAKLVFADIDENFMNLTLDSIKACVTKNTKAVVLMNYAGVGIELEEISTYCAEQNLILIEDNAQGIGAYDQSKRLGSFGDYSCISFDSLKNISCGEGGVILFKPAYKTAIETVFHNGTNRMAFEKGDVEAYEWVDLGSKFAISEYGSAILHPLLLQMEEIIAERRQKWALLYRQLEAYDVIRPYLPSAMCQVAHNAHIFYLLFENLVQRDKVLSRLENQQIACSFHYTPLHSSVFGLKSAYKIPIDKNTTDRSQRLLRLPIFNDVSNTQLEQISYAVYTALTS